MAVNFADFKDKSLVAILEIESKVNMMTQQEVDLLKAGLERVSDCLKYVRMLNSKMLSVCGELERSSVEKSSAIEDLCLFEPMVPSSSAIVVDSNHAIEESGGGALNTSGDTSGMASMDMHQAEDQGSMMMSSKTSEKPKRKREIRISPAKSEHIRPFKCHLCECAYSYNTGLYAHKKKAHPGKQSTRAN